MIAIDAKSAMIGAAIGMIAEFGYLLAMGMIA